MLRSVPHFDAIEDAFQAISVEQRVRWTWSLSYVTASLPGELVSGADRPASIACVYSVVAPPVAGMRRHSRRHAGPSS